MTYATGELTTGSRDADVSGKYVLKKDLAQVWYQKKDNDKYFIRFGAGERPGAGKPKISDKISRWMLYRNTDLFCGGP